MHIYATTEVQLTEVAGEARAKPGLKYSQTNTSDHNPGKVEGSGLFHLMSFVSLRKRKTHTANVELKPHPMAMHPSQI